MNLDWKDDDPFKELGDILAGLFGEFILYGMDGNYIGRSHTLDDSMTIDEVAVITSPKRRLGWLRILMTDLPRSPRTQQEADDVLRFGSGYSPPVSIELAKQMIDSFKNDDGGLNKWKNI